MRSRALILCLLVVGVAVVAIVFMWLFPLTILARRIASADHVVASTYLSSATLTITGAPVRSISEAVQSAKRDARSYANIFDVRVRFFRGTNCLGDVESSSRLFLVKGRQYRDDSEVLERLLVRPIHEMAMEERRERRQGQ